MPNCDYYATIEDHKVILDHLFEENECEIYELSSDFEKSLKQFHNTKEVLDEFNREYPNGKKWTTVHLQLFVLEAGFDFKPRKIVLNPKKCNGYKYRYGADQIGLIQLYLEIPNKNGLKNSHTNHNSEKRALKWAKTTNEVAEVNACDFIKITKFSSKLNLYIKKKAVAKISSRVILPGALDIWNENKNLIPYSPNEIEVELLNA